MSTTGSDVEALSSFYYKTCGPDWRTEACVDSSNDTDESRARKSEILAWLAKHSADFWLAIDPNDLELDEVNAVAVRELDDDAAQTALTGFHKQQQRRLREKSTGRFSGEEWEILKTSPLDLNVLRKDSCPLWIIQAARVHISVTKRRLQSNQSHQACCLVS